MPQKLVLNIKNIEQREIQNTRQRITEQATPVSKANSNEGNVRGLILSFDLYIK